MAEHYEVDKTRIYEDLKVIEDFYELKKDRGSYWIEAIRPLRWPRITSEEVQVLELVITASPLAKEQRFEASLKRVLEKLDTSLAEHIQSKLETDGPAQFERVNNINEAEEPLHLSENVEPIGVIVITTLRKIFAFWRRHFTTKGGSGGVSTRRQTEFVRHILHPYAIFFRRSDWYLEARSNLSENTSLTFKILRFQSVTLTDETFETPTDFSLSEDLASRWELFSGEPLSVTLKIAARKAYLVTEKEPSVARDYRTVCRWVCDCPLRSAEGEFTFWVLSLGDAAEYLSRQSFGKSLGRCAANA